MVGRHTVQTTCFFAGAAMCLALAGTPATAQRLAPADAAAKLTGTWKMNIELSPRFAPRGGGGGRTGGARGGGALPFYSIGMATPALGFQRGGGGGATMSDADRASAAAMSALQQLADTFSVKATGDSVTFIDPRGERTYAVDNKTTKITMGAATVTAKSRWDKLTLKQEFVSGETRVSHDWEMNDAGTRINFKMLVSSMSNPGPGTEAKAVYDKQP
jgi:hypothetical protein